MELSIYLGRMPIMDLDTKVFAYELLHRCSGENFTIVDDNVKATSRVLVNALNYIGLESLTAYKPALIKVDEKVLFDDLIFSINPEYFILEILEESFINEALVKRIHELYNKGYTFTLKHYPSNRNFSSTYKDILPLAHYIKIDIKRETREHVIQILESLKTLPLQVIAEKVEDEEDFFWAREAGFDLFEGYYFSKPQIYIKELIDPDSKILLQLLYLLKKESPIQEVISVFNNSPYLSVNVLKFIHLHQGKYGTKISSIEQALILIGQKKLTSWIELMIYAQKDDDFEEGETSPLRDLARRRAALMERLADTLLNEEASLLSVSAYLVGILSLAEDIFQSSYEKLFEQMSLDENISKAIKTKEGVLGNLLHLCIAVEANNFDDIKTLLPLLRLSQKQLNMAMGQAYEKTSAH